jgi:hypothetical protein
MCLKSQTFSLIEITFHQYNLRTSIEMYRGSQKAIYCRTKLCTCSDCIVALLVETSCSATILLVSELSDYLNWLLDCELWDKSIIQNVIVIYIFEICPHIDTGNVLISKSSLIDRRAICRDSYALLHSSNIRYMQPQTKNSGRIFIMVLDGQ